ncbi:MAG TPA: penicillin-insensitive murein endopeptidase [Pyrinomonadaceae bacterium]|jgi:tetratricopeptide (TPR) repeat protein/energy-coupling factor transporter ATP-binding protein EcfA2|nr:penicillin-insensitive murein endopeptidase [Pyrinomonadaceae bacterium]
MTMDFDGNGNPFPGLRPFETDEYNLFFGREGQSDELMTRLQRTRFLAVVGTSGSGKSSLVRAGLLPSLYGGLMAGAGSGWRVALTRPGHDPIGNLARSLAVEVFAEDHDPHVLTTIIETTLRRSTLGLVDAVRQARLPDYENVLVVVDQFEELFRYRAVREGRGTVDDAAGFVKLLLEAARQREVPVYVIITMRSDFLGDCSQFWGLPEAINDGQYLIPRMTRDERREAVAGPVAVGGGRISTPLVQRLLNDVGDNPDQLPILQHALMRTWDHWSAEADDSRPLDLPDYEAVGTMSDALSRHADEAFEELPDERSRLIAEKLFKALTERAADSRETRRPTSLREICDITAATPEEVASVVEVFRREGRSFLMPPPGVPLTAETVVDISHESLIRNWGRLKKWADEEAMSARIYRRLADTAALHREGREGLLQDPALQLALDWRERNNPTPAWGRRYNSSYDEAMAYLEASRAARDARREEEERRRRDELELAQLRLAEKERSARRLRYFLIALGVMFAVALVAFFVAYQARNRAEQVRRRLQMNRQALLMIQSYEMEKAEDALNELYRLNAAEGDREGEAWVLYNLGELNRKLQRHDRAAAFFESALENEVMAHGGLRADSVGTLDALAHTLEAARNYTAAAVRFEQLLQLLDRDLNGKGRYYKLNVANVYSDLADLYMKQAEAASPQPEGFAAAVPPSGDPRPAPQDGPRTEPSVVEQAASKAREQYRLALAIWEDVLRDDPDALADKYVETAEFFRERLGDKETPRALYEKVNELRRRPGSRLAPKKPIGKPNPGGDPGITAALPADGPGYTSFRRDDAGQFGRPAVIDFVKGLGAAWAARRPNVKLVIGDISPRGGGPFPPHLDHQDGREVDIWAVPNSGLAEPTNVFSPNYSRVLTRELILLIKQRYPTAVVYFDDPTLVAEGLTVETSDHDNYLHVLLP